MRDEAITAINCTSCGAGLDIYGGGRVKTHICGYCGTTLDAEDSYKALKKFTDAPRPNSPFSLGMKGEIFGVEFTIIGTLGVEERWGHEHWQWVEHQIYSPTHGYAWLNVEDGGHLTLSRKIRSAPSPAFVDEHRINIAETKPTASFDGDFYTYFESGRRTIYFAEGEFNWTPKANATSSTVSFAANDLMLTYVETATEREIEQSRYLEAGPVYASFGAKPMRQRGVHVLQNYKRTAGEGLRSLVAGALAILCFVFAAQMNVGKERIIDNYQSPFMAFPLSIPFTVTNADHLVQVRVWSDVSNSWAEFDIEIIDPEDQVLFETSRGVEYYSGYDDGNWSEGSRTTTLTFRPTFPGAYELTLSSPVSEVDWPAGRRASRVKIWIDEGIRSVRWLVAAGVLLVLLAALPIIRRVVHQRRRWSGTDWTDDE
ncbi:MAG: DUF4178 domain-containing protein [Pikeienuella sp.]